MSGHTLASYLILPAYELVWTCELRSSRAFSSFFNRAHTSGKKSISLFPPRLFLPSPRPKVERSRSVRSWLPQKWKKPARYQKRYKFRCTTHFTLPGRRRSEKAFTKITAETTPAKAANPFPKKEKVLSHSYVIQKSVAVEMPLSKSAQTQFRLWVWSSSLEEGKKLCKESLGMTISWHWIHQRLSVSSGSLIWLCEIRSVR